MRKNALTFLLISAVLIPLFAQEAPVYKVRLNIPVFDSPQNRQLPNHLPSMNQSLEWSKDFYELGYWGIDELGDRLFINKKASPTKWRKFSNNAFKYLAGLGFAKYGSELPIPLGVWGHEEFHRTVLGVAGISSKNGNWLFSRWDGTVYGISDETLDELKNENPGQLLYAYTSGVQYEILLNQRITLEDFYNKRSLYKSSLLLYNAHYVYNYFNFSTSPHSDSVKIIAPPHESPNPAERDFAGADLTSWAYDMFNPDIPFTSRDGFPNGEGVNRRVGFSDLSPEAQKYLLDQKKLSLLNFLNPAIFFINRININPDFSFNFFAQYSPTHFGNNISFFVPFRLKKLNFLLSADNYRNRSVNGMGLGAGLFDLPLGEKLEADFSLNYWEQPVSFWNNEKKAGGAVSIKTKYRITDYLSGYAGVTGKTEGWIMGNPYLEENFSFQLGLSCNFKQKK